MGPSRTTCRASTGEAGRKATRPRRCRSPGTRPARGTTPRTGIDENNANCRSDAAGGGTRRLLRLHDVSGAILNYQLRNRTLPEKLEDVLPFFPGASAAALECPASHRPYEYDVKGWKAQGLAGRIVVRDPTPAHGGHRWGIVIVEGASGQPASMRVLVVE